MCDISVSYFGDALAIDSQFGDRACVLENSELKLVTLGDVALDDGSLSGFHQPLVLLAYLAFNGRTTREDLATIFWSTAKNPRNSLSSALSQIRQVAPRAISNDPRTVETTLRSDGHDFLELIEKGDRQGALAIYHGDFLRGFTLRTVGLELEEWIFSTRDGLRRSATLAAYELMTSATVNGRYGEAGDWAERVLEITAPELLDDDELDAVHASLHRDRRVRAQKLRAEAQLFDRQLETPADSRPAQSAVATESGAIGNQGSQFIGRDHELAELRQKLGDRQSVNLFGLGGVGKSSLVAALTGTSWLQEEFDRDAVVIDLEAADGAQDLVQKLVSAMQLGQVGATVTETFDGVHTPTFVVVENVQPNSDIAAALQELVQIDNLVLLIVSRQQLRVKGCATFQLTGLDSRHLDSAAVELFRDRASRYLPTGAVASLDVDQILAICERVSGVPLAIGLAAAWLPFVSLQEITAMLDDVDLLEIAPPGEHLALGHMIDQTWNMLEPAAQKTLRDIAVMQGTFDRAAANAVCGASLQNLLQLQEHSLIEFLPAGRIGVHALIDSFAKRQLAADPARHADLLQQHQDHFVEQLRLGAVANPGAADSISRLNADHRNVVSAWRRLVSTRDWDGVESSFRNLHNYLHRSGQLFIANELFADTLEQLTRTDDHDRAHLVADLRQNLAWVLMLLGKVDEASRLCCQGLAHAPADAVAVRIALMRTQCALFAGEGRLQLALDGYRDARALVGSIDDPRLAALLDEDIGRVLQMLGDTEGAIVAFRSTLDAARTLDEPHMEARSYLLIAIAMSISEPERSLILFDDGEELAEKHGLRHLQAYFPRDRGFVLYDQSRFGDAFAELERGLPLATELGDSQILAGLRFGLARSALRQHDPHLARPHLEEGLRIATRTRLWPYALGAIMCLANFVLDDEPGNELAQQLFVFCRDHPQLMPEDLRRENNREVSAPGSELAADSRLDETCERARQLLRQATV